MAGSDTARRLRVRSGDHVVVIGDDAELRRAIEPLPPGATFAEPGPSDARVVIVVADDVASLPDRVRRGARAVSEQGTVWVVWRDRTPGLHLGSVRRVVTMTGLVPDGSARLPDRAALAAKRDREDRTFRDPNLRV